MGETGFCRGLGMAGLLGWSVPFPGNFRAWRCVSSDAVKWGQELQRTHGSPMSSQAPGSWGKPIKSSCPPHHCFLSAGLREKAPGYSTAMPFPRLPRHPRALRPRHLHRAELSSFKPCVSCLGAMSPGTMLGSWASVLGTTCGADTCTAGIGSALRGPWAI